MRPPRRVHMAPIDQESDGFWVLLNHGRAIKMYNEKSYILWIRIA